VARPFWHNLVPDEYFESIYDVDLDSLRAKGIAGLILDLDNTLAAWRFGEPEPRLAQWVGGAKARGFRVCILSNGRGPRVELFARFLDIPGQAQAGKPLGRAFRGALRRLGLPASEVAVIGDQIFTDILGAKRTGCRTVLVVPLSRREFVWTRFVRRVERAVLGRFFAKGRLGRPVRRDPGPEGGVPCG
jgi:HAD superfamily phosphatase (TIGR01668 family)